MRIFKRGKIWYIEKSRDERYSLKTSSERDARKILIAEEKEALQKKISKIDSTTNITLSEFLELYTTDPDRIGLAENTLNLDRSAFKALINTLGDTKLRFVDDAAIKKFKTVQQNRISKTAVNCYLGQIRAGLNWAVAEKILTEAPSVKLLKIGKRLPRFIHPEDLQKIFDTAESKPEMKRIIRFALYTGCRRGEIVAARYEHIRDGLLRIIGKGDKERVVPLLPQALDHVQDVGKIFKYTCATHISDLFKRICIEAGVEAKFHDLRHTAATQMLSDGIALEVVQRILGHSNIRTTQIYATVREKLLRDQMQKLTYNIK